MSNEEDSKLVRRFKTDKCLRTCDLYRDCRGFRDQYKRCPEWTWSYPYEYEREVKVE